MPLQLSWLEHLTLNQGVLGSSPRRGTMGRLPPMYTKGTPCANTADGTRGLDFLPQLVRLKIGNAAKPGVFNLYVPVAQWIEHRISNPLVRGSSPFGDTIYGFSSMERVSGYEPLDRGSTPLIRTNERTRAESVFVIFGARSSIAPPLNSRRLDIRRGKSHDFPLLFFELFYLELEVK